MKRLLLSVLFVLLVVLGVNAQNWPQFRGPGATGAGGGSRLNP